MKNHVLAIGKYANGSRTTKVVQGTSVIETTTTFDVPNVEVPDINLDVPAFMKTRTAIMRQERLNKDNRKVVGIFSNTHKKPSVI